MRTDRSLVRDERHYLMDKENDHSCKHSQRDSFIDTRAASHCYAFHSFPPSRRQCESPHAVTLHCFGERGVNCKSASPDGRAGLPFPVHCHMLRHACGYALAKRALQDWLGHRSIQHTVRYTELSPTRFKDFWRG